MKEQFFEHDLVPQVVETNINETKPPKDSIGFIYEWTNLTTGKWYRGKRNGPIKSGYLFSSEQPDFVKDFANTDYTWRYNIMNYVTTNKDDLSDLEYEQLSSMHSPKTGKGGAAKNPMSYNASNGIPSTARNEAPNLKKIEVLASRIMNQEFSIKKVEIEPLMEMIKDRQRVQARFKDRPDHINDIKEKINDVGGITKACPSDCDVKHNHVKVGCDPVVMLHGVTFRGKFFTDIIVDGNHTIQGAFKADKAVYLEQQDVPAEETEGWSDEELILLGDALNPPEEKTDIPNDRYDFELYMEQAYYNKKQSIDDINSKENKEAAKRIFKLSSGKTKSAISAVTNRVIKGKRNETGEVFCDYSTPAYSGLLDAAIRKANNLNGVYCISDKTSFYKTYNTVQVLNKLIIQKEEDPDFVCTELRIMLWHKDPQTETDWNNNQRNDREQENKNVLSKCGINVVFKYMPTWENADLGN